MSLFPDVQSHIYIDVVVNRYASYSQVKIISIVIIYIVTGIYFKKLMKGTHEIG